MSPASAGGGGPGGVAGGDPRATVPLSADLFGPEAGSGSAGGVGGGIAGVGGAGRSGGVWVNAAPLVEGPGGVIGPYHVLRVLGEGGFGIVYLAERRVPIVQRVAVKVIKPGMDSRLVVARFEQERQALAVMNHPGIAKVFDAGTTVGGRPYFAMEYVDGEPITQYCDRLTLGTRERLTLFVQVCEAVQHAHQRGIIHRDLKPSNVLVVYGGRGGGGGGTDGTEGALVKVIDFGIAKAIGRGELAKTTFTEHGQLIGTPEYMSPEQATGGGGGGEDGDAGDVDTRTDVYSLGVLLYELLVGMLPFDSSALRSAGYAEIQRVIREVEPPRPSTRLSQMGAAAEEVAKRRRSDLTSMRRELHRELEWIPLMAMRKRRRDRYRSADQLADDIRNYLEGKPLIAGPESVTYRASKFVKRHRVAATTGLVVALGLIAGAGGIVGGYVRATEAAEAERMSAERATKAAALAQQEAKRATELAAKERKAREDETEQRKRSETNMMFLLQMLASVSPENAKGREVTVREMLDTAAGIVGEAMKGQPYSEASLRSAIGQTYFHLGRFEEAVTQLTIAAELDEANLGAEDKNAMETRYYQAVAMYSLGKTAEATKIWETVYERRARVLGEKHEHTLITLSQLGVAKQRSGDLEGALAIFRRAYEGQAAALGAASKEALDTKLSIADALQHLGKLEEAEQAAAELERDAKAALGMDSRVTLTALSIRASILKDMGRYEEAERVGREAFEAKKKIFGMDHSDTLTTANVLGLILEQRKKYGEAETVLREAAEAAGRLRGAEDDLTLTYEANLARSLQLGGKLDEAEALMRRTLESRRRVNGNGDVATLTVVNNLGLLLLDRKKPEEAEELFRELIAGIDQVVPEGHWILGQARVNLGECLIDLGKPEEAKPWVEEGLERLRKSLPVGHDRIVKAEAALKKVEGK